MNSSTATPNEIQTFHYHCKMCNREWSFVDKTAGGPGLCGHCQRWAFPQKIVRLSDLVTPKPRK